jgi:hypothetical protein
MGTRNLTKVINSDGVTVVAQYGQWDGYPEGQGLVALHHARMAHAISNALPYVRFISEDEANALFAGYDFANGNFSRDFPTFSRDTGADILGVIAYSAGEVLLIDNSEFENDDLFCEGVYTIDFESNKFISNFGKVVEFDLSNLPTKEQYLEAFRA